MSTLADDIIPVKIFEVKGKTVDLNKPHYENNSYKKNGHPFNDKDIT